MVLILHQKYPFEHTRRNMDWDMRAETQGIDSEAVHVLPDIEAISAPTLLVESLIESGDHLCDPLVELFDLGVFTLVFDEVVRPPIKVEHKLHKEVVDLPLILPKELK